jgi:hypothetical protein
MLLLNLISFVASARSAALRSFLRSLQRSLAFIVNLQWIGFGGVVGMALSRYSHLFPERPINVLATI